MDAQNSEANGGFLSMVSNAFITTGKQIGATVKDQKDKILANEVDGPTEDTTHLCKTLRTYYDDKRQPYPAWLPPDPKKAPPPTPPAVQYSQPRLGAGYGATGGGEGGRAAGGPELRSLWAGQAAQQQGRESPQSLRQNRLGNRPAPQAQAPVANPLPSQRNGSSQQFRNQPPPADKRNRLLGQLGGSKARSPAANTATMADPMQGRQASYNSTSSGGSYDNRSAGGSYGKSGGQSAPMMSANSPWDTGDSGFTAEAYTADPDYGQSGSRRPGLPSGPGAGRRGLPNGPRGY